MKCLRSPATALTLSARGLASFGNTPWRSLSGIVVRNALHIHAHHRHLCAAAADAVLQDTRLVYSEPLTCAASSGSSITISLPDMLSGSAAAPSAVTPAAHASYRLAHPSLDVSIDAGWHDTVDVSFARVTDGGSDSATAEPRPATVVASSLTLTTSEEDGTVDVAVAAEMLQPPRGAKGATASPARYKLRVRVPQRSDLTLNAGEGYACDIAVTGKLEGDVVLSAPHGSVTVSGTLRAGVALLEAASDAVIRVDGTLEAGSATLRSGSVSVAKLLGGAVQIEAARGTAAGGNGGVKIGAAYVRELRVTVAAAAEPPAPAPTATSAPAHVHAGVAAGPAPPPQPVVEGQRTVVSGATAPATAPASATTAAAAADDVRIDTMHGAATVVSAAGGCVRLRGVTGRVDIAAARGSADVAFDAFRGGDDGAARGSAINARGDVRVTLLPPADVDVDVRGSSGGDAAASITVSSGDISASFSSASTSSGSGGGNGELPLHSSDGASHSSHASSQATAADAAAAPLLNIVAARITGRLRLAATDKPSAAAAAGGSGKIRDRDTAVTGWYDEPAAAQSAPPTAAGAEQGAAASAVAGGAAPAAAHQAAAAHPPRRPTLTVTSKKGTASVVATSWFELVAARCAQRSKAT